jgi:hypothetical protein
MHHKSNRLDGQSILVVTFDTSHNVLEKNIRSWQILLKKVRCINELTFLERRVRHVFTRRC